MNPKIFVPAVFLAAAVAISACWRLAAVHGSVATPEPASAAWHSADAARYLDSRQLQWQQWRSAQRDHGTLCVSCHTQLPYAMVRSALQRELNEPAAPAPETVMMRNVEYRVNHWADVLPFYSDAADGAGKTAESHATEAVVNAIILTSYDTQQGALRPITRKALDQAWALQQAAGGWQWQDFHLAPWESKESGYQGAAQLLIVVEAAPGGYAQEPAYRGNLEALRSYLRRQYAEQPIVNQLYVLWATDRSPGLLTAPERQSLLKQIRSLQREDGGWSLSSLDSPKRNARSWLHELRHPDAFQPSTASDGYATGLVTLALRNSGTDARDPSLQKGLAWLNGHQQRNGSWTASSLNEQIDPESMPGKFMSDAATGYAVLALQQAGIRPIQ